MKHRHTTIQLTYMHITYKKKPSEYEKRSFSSHFSLFTKRNREKEKEEEERIRINYNGAINIQTQKCISEVNDSN